MQDRDELIARGHSGSYENFRSKWIGDHEEMILDLVRDFVPRAALESRPAPTEERVQQFRQHYPTGCWPQPQGDYVGYCGCGVQFSGDTRGAAYDAWGSHVADATDTTPSRDEEGSVDREAIEEAVHRAIVKWSNGDQPKPIKVMVADAILALKTSKPETQIGEGGGSMRSPPAERA